MNLFAPFIVCCKANLSSTLINLFFLYEVYFLLSSENTPNEKETFPGEKEVPKDFSSLDKLSHQVEIQYGEKKSMLTYP